MAHEITGNGSAGSGNISISVSGPGDHLLMLGPTLPGGNAADFDSGNLSVSQDGIVFEELDAVAVPTRRIIYLRGGSTLDIGVTGGGNHSLVAVLEKVII